MTRSINPVAVSLLLDAAHSLQAYFPEAELRQESLDLTGENQAIEAFMDERASLKDRLNFAQYEIGVLQNQLQNELSVGRMRNAGTEHLVDELEAARVNDEHVTQVLLQTAKYVESLRAKLTSVGVTFAPGENGEAVVQVEPYAMLSFLDNALGE